MLFADFLFVVAITSFHCDGVPAVVTFTKSDIGDFFSGRGFSLLFCVLGSAFQAEVLVITYDNSS